MEVKKRSTMKRAAISAIALMVMPMLTACGGGGSSAKSVTKAPTGLSVSVQWPAPASKNATSRLIPAATNSILIEVLNTGGGSIAQKLLVRPTSPPWVSTADFNGITDNLVLLQIYAYPNADGTGQQQAGGFASVPITIGQSNVATVTMATTISYLTIAPSNPTVKVNNTLQLTASAFTLFGAPVIITPSKVNWSSNHPQFATVDSTGLVTGVAAGSTTITATDTESGKFGTVLLQVN